MIQRIFACLLLIAILFAVAYKYESADNDTKSDLFYFIFILNCVQHIYYSNKTDKLEKKIHKERENNNENHKK